MCCAKTTVLENPRGVGSPGWAHQRPLISRLPVPAYARFPGAAGSYPMLRNSASGLEIWFPARVSAGIYSGEHQNRPLAGRRADIDSFPIEIRPKSGPEI